MKKLGMSVGYAKVTRVETRRGVILKAKFRTSEVILAWNFLQDWNANFENAAESAVSRFIESECCYEVGDAPKIQGWIAVHSGTPAEEMVYVPILEGLLTP